MSFIRRRPPVFSLLVAFNSPIPFILFTISGEVFASPVNVWPKANFPAPLGQTASWLFTPKGVAEFHVDFLISLVVGTERAFKVEKNKCDGPMANYFSCAYKSRNEISVSFTPDEKLYGREITATYFKDSDDLWAERGVVLLKETIVLTKQPTFINMEMTLKEPSRYTNIVPTGLPLEPPYLLTGCTVKIDCVTDGSLPPRPINFLIECPPPPIAVIEEDRVTQAKQSLSYEQFYRTYGFRSPPTLSDLGPYVARKHANELLRTGHVVSKDNKTLRAILSINQKAHDCHVVCRVEGKEVSQRLTVYYPTTISYLLPRPNLGYMEVGSEITCYADGYPPPMMSLRLTQPLRPPKPLTEEEVEALRQVGRLPKVFDQDPVTRERMLANADIDIIPQLSDKRVNSGANEDPAVAFSGALRQFPPSVANRWLMSNGKQPYEDAKDIPGIGLSTIERHKQLGLHPNEYSIEGPTFRLARNATPGVELLLICTARNVLPGDTTFLSLNGTMTQARFVVAAVSISTLGISIGVCACVLVILLIVIAAMLLQKRRQSRLATGSQRLSVNGMKRSKLPPGPAYTKGQCTSRTTRTSNARSVDRPYHPTDISASPTAAVDKTSHVTYSGDPNYQYETTFNPVDLPLARTSSLSRHPGPQELQYVELSFDQPYPRTSTRDSGPTALRGGPNSASMTLFGTTPRSRSQPRPYGSSVPQGLNISGDPCNPSETGNSFAAPDDATSHYTEIVAIMQPKAYSSQLVLQQQQEATQALLALQQNKPRAFV